MQVSSRFTSVVALALAAMAAPAHALTQDLGTLTTSGVSFGNTFYANTASFTDYYTFSIADPGTVNGSTIDTSYVLFFTKDVTLNSVSLTSNSTSSVIAQDYTPSSFTFSSLSPGSYTLAVQGSVSGLWAAVGQYSGTISAQSSSVASAAPEPADLALTVVGLAGVGMLARRRVKR
jgi:hypothetical protein